MTFSSDQPAVTNQLPSTVNLPDIEGATEFNNAIQNLLRTVSDSCNSKTGGLYTPVEKCNNEQYYRKTDTGKLRNVYRKLMNFIDLNGGNIAGSVTVSFPHGIDSVKQSANISCNCTTSDNRSFTLFYPYIYINQTTAFVQNPLAVELTQCDCIIQCLKEL